MLDRMLVKKKKTTNKSNNRVFKSILFFCRVIYVTYDVWLLWHSFCHRQKPKVKQASAIYILPFYVGNIPFCWHKKFYWNLKIYTNDLLTINIFILINSSIRHRNVQQWSTTYVAYGLWTWALLSSFLCFDFYLWLLSQKDKGLQPTTSFADNIPFC